MKQLIVLLTLFLTGCSTLGSLQVGSFESGEYERASRLRTSISLAKPYCPGSDMKQVAAELDSSVLDLLTYSEGLPHNTDVVNEEVKLYGMTHELSQHYNNDAKASAVYCNDKLDILARVAKVLQASIGSKTK